MPVSPTRPKGPPLNALRAFEAAARLGGFSAAAEELCVTPAAVAQQIKALETWAGTPLFERRSQGVSLSPLGRDVARELRAAFDRIGDAAIALRQRARPNVVRVASLPSIAQLWLSPRLPRLRKLLPEMTISVTALERPPNLKREFFDIAIFYEELPETRDCLELSRDVIYPVCAPELATELRSPLDLAGRALISDETWKSDWPTWLNAAAPDLKIDPRGPSFSLYALAVEEAKNGAGVLIGHDALVRDLVAAGTLVAPFAHRITLDRALTLRVPECARPSAALDIVVRTLSGA